MQEVRLREGREGERVKVHSSSGTSSAAGEKKQRGERGGGSPPQTPQLQLSVCYYCRAKETHDRAMRKRCVTNMDALEWLRRFEDDSLPGHVFTSLPDISEFGGRMARAEYVEWFVSACALLMRKLRAGRFALFLQSDIRERKGANAVGYVDKSALCARAAERAGCALMWRKVCLTSAMDKASTGRPGFSHLLCYSKGPSRYSLEDFRAPDVFERGEMIWSKAIGLNCVLTGLAFLLQAAKADTVVDPFCGEGTVLAAANVYGAHSVGVDLSAKRCRHARTLRLFEVVTEGGIALQTRNGFRRRTAIRAPCSCDYRRGGGGASGGAGASDGNGCNGVACSMGDGGDGGGAERVVRRDEASTSAAAAATATTSVRERTNRLRCRGSDGRRDDHA